ncbi:hypothetical protein AMJ52_09345 [candidate division TA06 bacterium DG_78]|uniref:BioF2-like acetyltransferase domain-containing protein n=1 Tax=candidate division TA06 bacterium DG_78 TaxID=1703772 RepID=A0A0S7Y7Z6_UNCT6|nr:MAG: hypothetical protein AMJ52_09345 [candidate division TA06 bacterium DG_78]
MKKVYDLTKNYESILLVLEQNGEIHDLLLASLIKESGKLKESFSSRAIVIGGPLSKSNDIRPIVKAYDEMAAPKALYTQIRNLWDVSTSHQIFEEIGYSYEEHLNYIHDLTRPLEKIWAEFSEGRKKGIKKAESKGIKIKEGEEEDIDIFYDLVQETYKGAKVPIADKTLFKSAWRVMRPKNMIRFLMATIGDETLAGRMILTYHGILHDWYAGSTSTGRTLNANELIVWSAMQWGSKNGLRLFDFGGAGKPGEKYGPGEFKRRFGGEKTNYGRFEKVYHPVKHLVGKAGYKVIRRFG